MKKKIAAGLFILATALMFVFSPSAASAEECPDVYVQPAACNTENPPGVVTFETPPAKRLGNTGDEIDWTGWVVGGVLIVGGTIVIVDQARRKFKGEK